MSNWTERIKQVLGALDNQGQPQQLGQLQASLSQLGVDAETQRRTNNRAETGKILIKLQAQAWLERVKNEIWGGVGSIYIIQDINGNWSGLQLGFRSPERKVSSGYPSDAGSWVKTPSFVTSGYSEMYARVVVNMPSQDVNIQDGRIELLSSDGYSESEFAAIIQKGGGKKDVYGARDILSSEANAAIVGETLLQFGLDRISNGRLPRRSR